MKRRAAPAGVSRRLLVREHLHRRLVLLSLTSLLLLATLPILGHHVAEIGEPLSRLQHLGGLCVRALGQLFTPVHWGFHAALAAGLVYAMWDRFRAARTLTRTLAPLDSWNPGADDAIARAARSAGVDPRVVRVVPGLPNPAFTAGALAPRIYVAADIAGRLSSAELALVLAHEGAHVAHRDPLRLSVYRFLSCTLFWIPALRRLAEDMVDEAEIRADDVAGRREPLILASAILRLASCGSPRSVASTVGFESPDLLDRRVRRLAGEETSLPTHLTRLSLLWACLSVTLILTSGLAAAQSSPSGEAHCHHSQSFPLAHLICTGASWAQLSSRCSHAG